MTFVRNHWADNLPLPQRGLPDHERAYHGDPGEVLIGGPHARAGARFSSVVRRRSPKKHATQILSTLASCTGGPSRVRSLLRFCLVGRKGISNGLAKSERILAAPSFLFRPARAAGRRLGPSTGCRIDHFPPVIFNPDEALLDLADRGRLNQPDILNQQVRRMLRDDRSRALVDNFASQWLKLGKLAGVVPDVDAFPEFDDTLREGMQQETNGGESLEPRGCRVTAS